MTKTKEDTIKSISDTKIRSKVMTRLFESERSARMNARILLSQNTESTVVHGRGRRKKNHDEANGLNKMIQKESIEDIYLIEDVLADSKVNVENRVLKTKSSNFRKDDAILVHSNDAVTEAVIEWINSREVVIRAKNGKKLKIPLIDLENGKTVIENEKC